MLKKIIVLSVIFVFSIYPAAEDDIQRIVLRGHAYPVWSAVFNNSGDRVATVSADGTVGIWNLQGCCLAMLKDDKSPIRKVLFSLSDNCIITVSDDKKEQVWDIDGRRKAIIADQRDRDSFAAVYPLLRAFGDGKAQVWDPKEHRLIMLEGHTDKVNSAAFNRRGDRIVTTSDDETVKIWDLQGHCLATCIGRGYNIYSASFSTSGDRIVTLSDEMACVWDLEGHCLTKLVVYPEYLRKVAFNNSDDRIVTITLHGVAQVWDLEGHRLFTLRGFSAWLSPAPFERIVIACSDGYSRVWNFEGHCLATLEGHTRTVHSAKFNNSGDSIVTTSEDKTAIIWRDRRPGLKMRAFALALHPRLGKDSPAHLIDGYVMQWISEYVRDQAFEPVRPKSVIQPEPTLIQKVTTRLGRLFK